MWLMTSVLCVYPHLCNVYAAWVLAGLEKRIRSSHSYQSEMEDIVWVLDCTRFVSRRRNPPHPRIQLLLSIVCSQIVYILLAWSQCTLKDTQIKMIPWKSQKENPLHLSLSFKIKMNFREKEIKCLNLGVCGARIMGSKAEIKRSSCLPEADRGWRKYCWFQYQWGNRSLKVN